MNDLINSRTVDVLAWGTDGRDGLVIMFWVVAPGEPEPQEDGATMDPAHFARLFLEEEEDPDWLYHQSVRFRVTYTFKKVEQE